MSGHAPWQLQGFNNPSAGVQLFDPNQFVPSGGKQGAAAGEAPNSTANHVVTSNGAVAAAGDYSQASGWNPNYQQEWNQQATDGWYQPAPQQADPYLQQPQYQGWNGEQNSLPDQQQGTWQPEHGAWDNYQNQPYDAAYVEPVDNAASDHFQHHTDASQISVGAGPAHQNDNNSSVMGSFYGGVEDNVAASAGTGLFQSNEMQDIPLDDSPYVQPIPQEQTTPRQGGQGTILASNSFSDLPHEPSEFDSFGGEEFGNYATEPVAAQVEVPFQAPSNVQQQHQQQQQHYTAPPSHHYQATSYPPTSMSSSINHSRESSFDTEGVQFTVGSSNTSSAEHSLSPSPLNTSQEAQVNQGSEHHSRIHAKDQIATDRAHHDVPQQEQAWHWGGGPELEQRDGQARPAHGNLTAQAAAGGWNWNIERQDSQIKEEVANTAEIEATQRPEAEQQELQWQPQPSEVQQPHQETDPSEQWLSQPIINQQPHSQLAPNVTETESSASGCVQDNWDWDGWDDNGEDVIENKGQAEEIPAADRDEEMVGQEAAEWPDMEGDDDEEEEEDPDSPTVQGGEDSATESIGHSTESEHSRPGSASADNNASLASSSHSGHSVEGGSTGQVLAATAAAPTPTHPNTMFPSPHSNEAATHTGRPLSHSISSDSTDSSQPSLPPPTFPAGPPPSAPKPPTGNRNEGDNPFRRATAGQPANTRHGTGGMRQQHPQHHNPIQHQPMIPTSQDIPSSSPTTLHTSDLGQEQQPFPVHNPMAPGASSGFGHSASGYSAGHHVSPSHDHVQPFYTDGSAASQPGRSGHAQRPDTLGGGEEQPLVGQGGIYQGTPHFASPIQTHPDSPFKPPLPKQNIDSRQIMQESAEPEGQEEEDDESGDSPEEGDREEVRPDGQADPNGQPKLTRQPQPSPDIINLGPRQVHTGQERETGEGYNAQDNSPTRKGGGRQVIGPNPPTVNIASQHVVQGQASPRRDVAPVGGPATSTPQRQHGPTQPPFPYQQVAPDHGPQPASGPQPLAVGAVEGHQDSHNREQHRLQSHREQTMSPATTLWENPEPDNLPVRLAPPVSVQSENTQPSSPNVAKPSPKTKPTSPQKQQPKKKKVPTATLR